MRYLLFRPIAIQVVAYSSLLAASWSAEISRANVDYDRGLYREAAAEYKSALPLANTPLYRGVTLFRLALAQGNLDELAGAERSYKEAAAIFRSTGDARRMASSLAGLGEIYRAQYRFEDALVTERNALKILKRVGMLETPPAATIFTITGEILHDQNHLKAAQKAMQRALRILENKPGPEDADLATSLNNLGVVASERKRLSEAEILLARALRIRRARLGSEHPLVASTMLSLSLVYMEQYRYTEAEQTCRGSIEIWRHFLPSNHPDIIKAHVGLAIIAHQRGDGSTAVRVLEEVAGTFEGEHPRVTGEYLKFLNLYAQYLAEAGQTDRSRQIRLQARQLWEESGWKAPTRSTISASELAAGGLR